MGAAIQLVDLRKAYGPLEAVRGVTFDVAPGEIFALLGPNGAGKTTIVEILEGYRSADSGEARVLGIDPATGGTAYRERIGVVLQDSGVYPYMSVREAVTLFAGWYRKPRPVADVLRQVDLTDAADRRVRLLSGGQRRRLDVALALVGDPEVLFLDEPTTGFDPGARRAAWETIGALAAGGTTIFLTTHYMEEAQALAQRVAVLRQGEIVALGPPSTLGRPGRTQIRFVAPAGSDAATFAAMVGGTLLGAGEHVVVEVDEPTRALHRLTGWAVEHGTELERLEVVRPSLEDVYLALTEESA
jgi:ABC-type multidrug transport system ATPase subunit